MFLLFLHLCNTSERILVVCVMWLTVVTQCTCVSPSYFFAFTVSGCFFSNLSLIFKLKSLLTHFLNWSSFLFFKNSFMYLFLLVFCLFFLHWSFGALFYFSKWWNVNCCILYFSLRKLPSFCHLISFCFCLIVKLCARCLVFHTQACPCLVAWCLRPLWAPAPWQRGLSACHLWLMASALLKACKAWVWAFTHCRVYVQLLWSMCFCCCCCSFMCLALVWEKIFWYFPKKKEWCCGCGRFSSIVCKLKVHPEIKWLSATAFPLKTWAHHPCLRKTSLAYIKSCACMRIVQTWTTSLWGFSCHQGSCTMSSEVVESDYTVWCFCQSVCIKGVLQTLVVDSMSDQFDKHRPLR